MDPSAGRSDRARLPRDARPVRRIGRRGKPAAGPGIRVAALRVQLLGQRKALGLLDDDCLRDLVSGGGQVSLRIGTQLLVEFKRQLNAGEAVRIGELTQERDGEAPAKFASLPGDVLVSSAEYVLRLHATSHVPTAE